MSKPLPLLLSAVLAFGSVFTTSAAPLLKKACADNSPRGEVLAARVDDPSLSSPKRIDPSSRLAKRLPSGNVEGLMRVESPTRLKNTKALKSATSARRALGADIDLRGVVLSFVNSALYRLPKATGEDMTLLKQFEAQYQFGAIDDGNGHFHGVNYTQYGPWTYITLETYDTSTWELISSTPDLGYEVCSTAAALDPVSGDIYGCFYADEGDYLKYVWAKADYENFTSIPIADMEVDLVGLGADNRGQYYGIGTDAILYKIDKNTGEMEALAPVDVPTQSPFASGCVNTSNNTFLQTYASPGGQTGGSGLVEIDLETGETTRLLEFSGNKEVMGLHIAEPLAREKAPAAPGISVSCENGSMEARITLTMPETLVDGTPAPAQTFFYSVMAQGEEVMAGEAVAGAQVVETVTLTSPGKTNFIATASNSAGVSPKAKMSCFIGKGAPAAPKNVKLSWADGVATLTWDAVTTSSDGGFFDPAEVTYTIIDGNGEELATQSKTTFTTPEPERDEYTVICYKVKANHAGRSSAVATSNNLALGALKVPFTMDMSLKENFQKHDVVDANGDGYTWKFSSDRTMYSFNSFGDADDWLFSPAVSLETGKVYKITTNASAKNGDYSERVEVLAGSSPAIEDMVIEVVGPTVVSSETGQILEAHISVPTNGNYYFGFHAISDMDRYELHLNSYAIESMEGSGPVAVTDATILPDADGALKAAISFKAPLKSLDGNDLTGQVRIKVLRDETQIGDVTLDPGGVADIEDSTVPVKGTYTYSFVPYNSIGVEGETLTVSAYVGPQAPASINPATVSLVETSPGTFVLSWDPVSTTADGKPVKPSNISYKVYAIDTHPVSGSLVLGDEIATVTEPSYTHVTDPIVEQGYFRLGVLAFNIDRGAEYTAVGSVFTGHPYEMPVGYSNDTDLENYFMAVGGTGQVSLVDYNSFKIPAQDDEVFFALLNENKIDATTSLVTGVVNISGENPVVQLYVWPVDANDINQTVVSVICDGEETPLKTIVHSDEFYYGTWNKLKVSLADYVGKAVQIRVASIVKRYRYAMYDNIRICQDTPYDLAAVNISAPAKVATGAEFDVTVIVANEGAKDAGPYSVNLLRDGEVVATKAVPSRLEAEDTQIVVFKQSMDLYDDENADFQAEVVYEADENPGNNRSQVISVARNISTFPRVGGLDGEKTDGGNLLSWSPVILDETTPSTVTEDFEAAESWAHEFEGWTFVDGDQKPLGGFLNGVDIPGITPSETKASFFVFDTTLDAVSGSSSFAAHSGDKYLAALFPFDDGQVDDWAISPLLSGDAQTISFFARSYSYDYPEKIEVWYSTTDTDIDSFVKIAEFGTQTVSDSWTQYSAELPQGAKHFAIRSVATGSWMLMVDDVTYTRLGGFDGQLKGYNVYCDGVKLNDAPVSEASYLHVPTDDVAHTYHVTAVYDKGESELSEPVTIEQSGIGSVLATGLKVAVEGRSIVVTGAGDSLVTINAVDGKTLHAAKGDARVAVAPAVYLVTVDRKTVKVIVR